VEGGWLFNGLKKGAFPALTLLNTPTVFIFCWARFVLPESAGLPKGNIVSFSNTPAAAPIAPPEAAVSSQSYITTR